MAGGRPTIITEAVLQKLEEAFSLGCTDKEACVLADIAPSTLYNYQEANPEFLERKEQLKEKPILKARKTVVDSLEGDVNSAWKYLERKDKSLNPKPETEVHVEKLQINDEQFDQLIRARTARTDNQ